VFRVNGKLPSHEATPFPRAKASLNLGQKGGDLWGATRGFALHISIKNEKESPSFPRGEDEKQSLFGAASEKRAV